MNLAYVKHHLQANKWKHVHSGHYASLELDLIADRRYSLDNWHILVNTISRLDINAFEKLVESFEVVTIKSYGANFISNNFLLYIITQEATPQALHRLKTDKRLFRDPSLKKISLGKIFIVDEKEKQVLGPFPPASKDEKKVPQGVTEIFINAFAPDSMAFPEPALHAKLAQLTDDLLPASVLKLLEGNTRPELELFRVYALQELGRHREAADCLEAIIPGLQGDDLARALQHRSWHMLDKGLVDDGIFSLEEAAKIARNNNLRAAIMASKADFFARKHCWGLAEKTIQEALLIAHDEPRVHICLARLRLAMDQRLEARAVYERMTGFKEAWVKSQVDYGRAVIAYLLGEFDETCELAKSALQFSDEIIYPLLPLMWVAVAKNDLKELENLVAELEKRSPKCDILEPAKADLARLQTRFSSTAKAPQSRLKSFPTLVQRRNYCGPSTIELVLQYWKGGLDLTNDQIAEKVKHPKGGTPIHRMMEFFHLVGFNTFRSSVPVDKLKQLVDAGYPVIIEEEAAGNFHVTVAIGYDDDAGTIELQDPMTHIVEVTPVEDLNRLRQIHFNSAIVAFPAWQGHEEKLARLGLFDDEVLSLSDQVELLFENERFQSIAELMAQAVQKQPLHRLSWISWLNAELDLWQDARRVPSVLPGELAARLSSIPDQDVQAARHRFYSILAKAKEVHPDTDFVLIFEGLAALKDQDLTGALAAFEKAKGISPDDPRVLSDMSECLYSLREVEKAMDSAREALKHDPASQPANVWMARCLAELGNEHAEHYAQAGLELAPSWWMAHQAMAEAYLRQDRFMEAWREVEIALSLSPNQPDAHLLRAELMATWGNDVRAANELESALKQTELLTPIITFKAHQTICRLFFKERKFDNAIEQVNQFLSIVPNDAWALQFLAAAHCERLLQAKQAGSEPEMAEITHIQHLYETAIEANQAKSWIVRDYLRYLSQLGRQSEAVDVAASLREKYPDQNNLAFVHGEILNRLGQPEPAADAMLAALKLANGLQDDSQLFDAIRTVIQGKGPEAGEKAILEAPLPEGHAPMKDRLRVLGLVLALYPKEKAARARELLEPVLASDPDDAYAVLRFGDVTEKAAEREKCYRKALYLAPRWSFARSYLADYLIKQDRDHEALEFTTGYENESLDLMIDQAYALNEVGRFEEASDDYEKALRGMSTPDQRTSWLYYHKWGAELNCGRYDKSLATAEEGLRLFQSEPVWFFYRVISLCYLKRMEEAAQTIETGKAHSLSEIDTLRSEYQIAFHRPDYPEALRLAERLLAATEEKAANGKLGWWATRRLSLLAELGRVEEARKFADSNSLNAQGWGLAAFDLASTRADALTLDFADEALKLDPKNENGLYARAKAIRGLDWQGARQAFVELQNVAPFNHSSYENLALYLALEGKLDEAQSSADRAVGLGTYCPYAWASKGFVRFTRGQHAEALLDLQAGWNRAGIEQQRGNTYYWWLLSALRGDRETAKAMKKNAVERASSSFERQVLRHIDTLLTLMNSA